MRMSDAWGMELRTSTPEQLDLHHRTAATFKMAVPLRRGITICVHPVNHLAAYGSRKPARIFYDPETTIEEFKASILATYGVKQTFGDQLFVLDWLEESSPLNPGGGAGYSAPSSPEGGAVVNSLPIVLWTRFGREMALHLRPADPIDGTIKHPAFARPCSSETRSLHVSTAQLDSGLDNISNYLLI